MSASVNENKRVLNLYALRRRKDTGEWALIREREEPAEGTCIKACRVVLDEKYGTKNLFLFSIQRPTASKSGTETTVYSLVTYSSASERQTLHCMHTTESKRLPSEELGRVSILDGPIVVWSEGKQLQVLYPVDHSHRMLRQTYDIENLISDGYRLTKVDDVWPFLLSEERDIFDVNCSSLLVFLKLKIMSDPGDQSITEWVCLQIKLCPQGLVVKLLRESELIPRDYGRISTCVAVHTGYSASLTTGDIVTKCQYLVGTEHSLVVVLHRGAMVQSVSLKYVPCQIALLDVRI